MDGVCHVAKMTLTQRESQRTSVECKSSIAVGTPVLLQHSLELDTYRSKVGNPEDSVRIPLTR